MDTVSRAIETIKGFNETIETIKVLFCFVFLYNIGNQPWIFVGKTDAEAKAAMFWSPDVKRQLIGKHPDAGKDWRQEEKGMTEDEMVEWYHWLNGHEFEQTAGNSEGQGSLAYCSPWAPRVRHDLATE